MKNWNAWIRVDRKLFFCNEIKINVQRYWMETFWEEDFNKIYETMKNFLIYDSSGKNQCMIRRVLNLSCIDWSIFDQRLHINPKNVIQKDLMIFYNWNALNIFIKYILKIYFIFKVNLKKFTSNFYLHEIDFLWISKLLLSKNCYIN